MSLVIIITSYAVIIASCAAVILGDNTYYVRSSTTDDCPQPCHPLSYYINDTATYFTSNATFIFMEGEHLLDKRGSAQISVSNLSNLTLRGERSGDGVVIRCGSNTHGLAISNTAIVNIDSISITGCGKQTRVAKYAVEIILGLSLSSIALLSINRLAVYDNLYSMDISISIGSHTSITNSRFHSNDENGLNLFYNAGLGSNASTCIANSSFIGNHNGLHMRSRAWHNISVTGSVFSDNEADGMYVFLCASIAVTIVNSSFYDHGGYGGYGLVVWTYSDTNSSIVTVIGSKFARNIDGMAIHPNSGLQNNICLEVSNSLFANNSGYGIRLGYNMESVANLTAIDVTIASSVFANNGYIGLHVRGSHRVSIAGSTFTAATGNRLCFFEYVHNMLIVNSSISNGGGTGLTVLCETFFCTLELSQVDISSNSASGIQAFGYGSIIFTKGHSIIADNTSPDYGAGIYLAGSFTLASNDGGHINFTGNTARRHGGAIYSADNDYKLAILATDVYCTIAELSASFVGNSAGIAGDILYGGRFLSCRSVLFHGLPLWLVLDCGFLIPGSITRASTSVHPLSPISSDPLVICPCVNDSINCTVRSLDREVYPEQIFTVSLVTVGICGGVSPGGVAMKHNGSIALISSSTNSYTSTSCTALNYTVRLDTYVPNATLMIDVADGDLYNNIGQINVHLSIIPCPLGLILSLASEGCVCRNDIAKISQVVCNISWMPYPIQRSGNNWISHQYGEYNCTIAHAGCPFDYCNTSSVKFALNNSDLQCNYNRSGILCGQCIPGLSLMIGSNRCANCTDTTLVSVSIVILTAVAGIVLVVLLMVLNLTVSVGSINGLLFYANIVKLNESIFFSRGNIPFASQFISWCNLDLGIEYCFIEGLDGYVKTWLQFAFPLYVWALVIVIIVGCRYSGRLTRLCGRNAVPVLATLILMSYTKLSRTVTNALMMNTLQCGEYKWSVWNVDGNIPYLSGKHIALFAVSLLLLVAGLVYTGLVFSFQWLQRHSGKCCKSTRDPIVQAKPLIDAYTGPFKDRYRFWTGLCLIVRLMLTVVFSFTTTLQSKLNNYIILLAAGSMNIFAANRSVYTDKRLTALEIVSLINLVGLSVMTILFTESYHDTISVDVVVGISVAIEMLLFIAVAMVHGCLAVMKMFPKCKCKVPKAPSHKVELESLRGERDVGTGTDIF